MAKTIHLGVASEKKKHTKYSQGSFFDWCTKGSKQNSDSIIVFLKDSDRGRNLEDI